MELGRRLATPERRAEAMSAFLDDLRRALRVQGVALRIPDQSSDELVLVASSLTRGVRLRLAPRLPLSHGIAPQAFKARRPMVSNDYASDILADPLLRGQRVGAVLAIPIMVEDLPIAMLSFIARRPGHFTPRRVQRASELAGRFQALSQAARLAQALTAETGRGKRRVDAFRAAAAGLRLEDTPEATLGRLVDTARELVDARYGALALWNCDGAVEQFVTSGIPPEERRRMGPLPQGRGLLGVVRDGGAVLRLADLTQHPQSVGFPPHHPPMRSFLGAPVLRQGQPAGTFYMTEKQGAAEFTQDDESILSLFATTASVVLENVSLYTSATRQRRLLAAVQESMADGLVLVDDEGRVAYCNPQAQMLFGPAPEGAVGRPLAEALRARAGDLEEPGVVDRLVPLLGALSDPMTIEIGVARPRRQDLAVTVFAVQDHGTRGLVIRDATEERDLARRRDAFVSITSHELRTPMTAIVGFTELLLKREVAPERRRAWLQEVHDEARRLAAIVDDLLNLSRIQSGKLPVRWEPVEVAQVAEAVLTALKPTTDLHEFVVAIPGDVPEAWADWDKVEQVLTNLVGNAVKYSPRGGKVTVAARHDEERQRVVVSVADQGIGIAPEDKREIFTSFHRIRRPETEGIRGTGLGLYIVKALVELMQGEVWVESELGRGSTFCFALPTQHDDILGWAGVALTFPRRTL